MSGAPGPIRDAWQPNATTGLPAGLAGLAQLLPEAATAVELGLRARGGPVSIDVFR